MTRQVAWNRSRVRFAVYLAEDGDQCDSCGHALAQDQRFLGPTLAVRWRFCSRACLIAGPTGASRKARFIARVLNTGG